MKQREDNYDRARRVFGDQLDEILPRIKAEGGQYVLDYVRPLIAPYQTEEEIPDDVRDQCESMLFLLNIMSFCKPSDHVWPEVTV